MRTDGRAPTSCSGSSWGSGVMLLGLLLTLDNFGLLEARQFIRLWPVLLIGRGSRSSPTAGTRPRAGRAALLVPAAASSSSISSVLERPAGLWPCSWSSGARPWSGEPRVPRGRWRRRRSRRRAATSTSPASWATSSAVTGAQDFRGGTRPAVMAACEIDLRKASIESEEAVLDTFAFWGGIEIRVPEDWTVESRGVALLGAFEDTSRRPDDGRKKLIVTGYAVMGGVEVKN